MVELTEHSIRIINISSNERSSFTSRCERSRHASACVRARRCQRRSVDGLAKRHALVGERRVDRAEGGAAAARRGRVRASGSGGGVGGVGLKLILYIYIS